jgi:hypothetical protein
VNLPEARRSLGCDYLADAPLAPRSATVLVRARDRIDPCERVGTSMSEQADDREITYQTLDGYGDAGLSGGIASGARRCGG